MQFTGIIALPVYAGYMIIICNDYSRDNLLLLLQELDKLDRSVSEVITKLQSQHGDTVTYKVKLINPLSL